MSDSRSTYAARMHRVQAHIDRHLAAPLDLATLAAVAHFSPFHFHRLFTAWMGETLGDYLRRRRLEVGAMRLLSQPRSTVLDVALGVGFGSAEAFARAFRTRFQCTPSQWRERGGATPVVGEVPFTPSFEPPPQTVRVEERPEVDIAYLRYVGPFGLPVGQFWRDRVEPWLRAEGLFGRPTYGVSHDDPTIVDPQVCRYDAGVEIEPGRVCGGESFRTRLPGGRYAVLPFEDRMDRIGGAWTSLWRDWLPQSGWQFDPRPCFEHYPPGSGLDPATGLLRCEICVPVTPL